MENQSSNRQIRSFNPNALRAYDSVEVSLQWGRKQHEESRVINYGHSEFDIPPSTETWRWDEWHQLQVVAPCSSDGIFIESVWRASGGKKEDGFMIMIEEKELGKIILRFF